MSKQIEQGQAVIAIARQRQRMSDGLCSIHFCRMLFFTVPQLPGVECAGASHETLLVCTIRCSALLLFIATYTCLSPHFGESRFGVASRASIMAAVTQRLQSAALAVQRGARASSSLTRSAGVLEQFREKPKPVRSPAVREAEGPQSTSKRHLPNAAGLSPTSTQLRKPPLCTSQRLSWTSPQ